MPIRRQLIPLFLLLPVVAGCNQLGVKQEGPPPEAPPAPAPEPAKPAEPEPPPEPPEIGAIIDMLEQGKLEKGRRVLQWYLHVHPDSPTAESLLAQLEADPREALGPPAREYAIREGDTLGALAAEHLGNPMKFVILARYNGIDVSRNLRVGQVIKLPASDHGEKTEKMPRSEDAGRDEKTAEAPAGGAPEYAPAALDHQATGLEALERGEDKTAYLAFKRAVAIEPTLQPAKRHMQALARQIATRYHERALAAYQAHDLDRAIDLWNRALEIAPDYQAALGYRARAMELRRRLQQLDERGD